jgi:glutathione S-transferase
VTDLILYSHPFSSYCQKAIVAFYEKDLPFTQRMLEDAGAAPGLLYAHWTHPIPKDLTHLWAYRRRLLARPSYARALDEARPYRGYFPLGAPDED